MESIGNMIKNKVEEQGRSVQWLAKKLSCHRSNIYDIFNRNNIDVSLLMKISTILEYNFMKDIADHLDEELKWRIPKSCDNSSNITQRLFPTFFTVST